MAQRLSQIFTLLAGLYGGAISLFLLARLLFGEPTLLAIGNRYLPPLLLLAPLMLLACLLLRKVRVALLCLPALIVLLVSYAPLYLPNAQIAPADAPTFTVATYNLARLSDENSSIISVIAALDADVIALQELSIEAAAALETHLIEAYPYQALSPHENGYDGHGLLSRYPILEEYSYPYEPTRLRLQRVLIDLEGVPIIFYNAHPQPVTESWRPPDVMIQREQIAYIVQQAATDTQPRILLGDFNTNDQSSDYQGIIRAGYNDAFYVAGWGMGFTNPAWGQEAAPTAPDWLRWVPPHRRIDLIFYDQHFTVLSAEVAPATGGSDHYPVSAHLALIHSQTS